MDKKLPGIYANKIDGKAANNEKVAYSKNDEVKDSRVDEVKESEISFTSQKNINQKLSEIFNSPRYVYKADVTITLKDKQIQRKIIGQNKTHLITIENELIPISDILDIHFMQ